MAKIASLIRSYGSANYLMGVLQQYLWLDRVLVMNYRFKNTPPIKDCTMDAVGCFPNVDYERGDGLLQHEVYNRGLEKLKDYDLIFVTDDDEFLTRVDQQTIIDRMLLVKDKNVACTHIIDYRWGVTHKLPPRTHKPPVAVKPDIRFYHVRCYHGANEYFDINLHHFGYAKLEDELKWKLTWQDGNDIGAVESYLKEPAQECPPPPREIVELIYG